MDKNRVIEDIKKLIEIIKNPDEILESYSQRRIGRQSVGDVEISTAWTQDMGYETAIITDREKLKIYPVERYEDFVSAVIGHQKWINDIPNLDEITDIGYGSLIEPKKVKIR